MLKDATSPSDALKILEESAVTATRFRQMFLEREDVEVKYTRPIDLAYQGSKRNGTIGKAHHTVHYNFALKNTRRRRIDPGEGCDDHEKKSKAILLRRFATLFNLTMHQAISEKGSCKAVFAEMLVSDQNLMSSVTGGLDLYRYPKTFAAVSPSRMHGSFMNYLDYALMIQEDINTNLPHDQIITEVCKLEPQPVITPMEVQEWAAVLDYRIKNNYQLWNNVSATISREEDETWLSYFMRKAEVVNSHKDKDSLIAHMFYSLRATSTEYVGVLFATLDLTGELKLLEEHCGSS